MDGTLKWSCKRIVIAQGEMHQQSLVIRIEKSCEGRRHLTSESLKTFIPNFVAFFVLLGIALSFIRKMSSLVTWPFGKTGVYAGHCFTIHLPEGGQCPLVRDSEPIRLHEIPTSLISYMLINNYSTNTRWMTRCEAPSRL